MSFSYDSQLAALATGPVATIPQVIDRMESIDALLDGAQDGLKWFNWLYLQVTKAVESQVTSPAGFIAVLDVQFATLYFDALSAYLNGGRCPASWRVLFDRRADASLAPVQFAIAGINAHINRDLPYAILSTCRAQGIVPAHESPQYTDYTALNGTLDSLIETAKQELMVNLPGDRRLIVNDLEWEAAAWNLSIAREAAWHSSEVLWNLRKTPFLTRGFETALDDSTELAGRVLLTPI